MPLPTRVRQWPDGSYRVTLVFSFDEKTEAERLADAVDWLHALSARCGLDGARELAHHIVETRELWDVVEQIRGSQRKSSTAVRRAFAAMRKR